MTARKKYSKEFKLDAMAILFAQASGKIDLLGISTVFGNAIIIP
jgi:hypothetical protein